MLQLEKRIITHVEWWRSSGTKEISPHLTTHTSLNILEHENLAKNIQRLTK